MVVPIIWYHTSSLLGCGCSWATWYCKRSYCYSRIYWVPVSLFQKRYLFPQLFLYAGHLANLQFFFFFFQYLPQTYNYHPILSRDDEETGQGNPRDCAICMLPVDTSSTGPPGLNMLNRAQYMLTPCQHLFHTDCLEQVCWFNNIEIIQILVLLISLFQWMRIKLECPVCRSYLPVCWYPTYSISCT